MPCPRFPFAWLATLVCVSLATLPGSVAAGSGLTFLRLSSGARTAALAEAATAVADAEALSYNPAALTTQPRLGLTHTQWLEGVRHDYLTGVCRRNENAIAAAVQVSRADGLEHRVGPSVEPLGEFGVYEWTAGLGWARTWGPGIRLGAALKAVRQSIYTEVAAGVAADIGILYRLSPRLAAGAALRNVGRMSDLDREATELPMQFRAGVAGQPDDAVLVTVDGQWARGGSGSLHLGAEWKAGDRLALRAGYQTGDTRDLALGLGVAGRSWSLDYAFLPFGSDLGDAHLLSLSLGPAAWAPTPSPRVSR